MRRTILLAPQLMNRAASRAADQVQRDWHTAEEDPFADGAGPEAVPPVGETQCKYGAIRHLVCCATGFPLQGIRRCLRPIPPPDCRLRSRCAGPSPSGTGATRRSASDCPTSCRRHPSTHPAQHVLLNACVPITLPEALASLTPCSAAATSRSGK